MELPNVRYILNRIVFFVILAVAARYGFIFIKQEVRKRAIAVELQSITSDSSFFRQFYAADAHKTLIRAVGLIAEANSLGMPPDTAIDRGMGIKPEFFENDAENDEPPPREKIIRTCLRGNYENFLKLGYSADSKTLHSMKKGEFPPIPGGPQSGRTPQIANLISPTISPGMEKVLANLEIRPPQAENAKQNDIELAAAKELARDLAHAGIIEESVRERILKGLAPPTP